VVVGLSNHWKGANEHCK